MGNKSGCAGIGLLEETDKTLFSHTTVENVEYLEISITLAYRQKYSKQQYCHFFLFSLHFLAKYTSEAPILDSFNTSVFFQHSL